MKILGLGNRYRSDDAVGLVVAERVGGMLLEGEPIELIDAWEGEDAVVVVDAVASGSPPGTLHRLDAIAEPLPPELFAGSTHHLGLADAVELARVLRRLPEQLIVIGIEGASWEAGIGLSTEVEAAVESAADAVREEVRACTSAP